MNASIAVYSTSTSGQTPLDSQLDTAVQLRWTSLLLSAFMILGAAGNLLVCIAIFTDRRLQNVTNYFLFSLAIADLLVSLIVMPLSILTELHDGYWYNGFTLCAGYLYADVFLCSASIVHMSIISLDRYLGISRPLKTRNKSKLAVVCKIIVVWIVTTMISCPIAILAIVHPSDIFQNNVCSIENPYFLIYGSTLAFLIPCLIMLATYVRTTQLLRQQALLCSGNGSSGRSQDGNPSMGLRRTRTRQRRSKKGSRKRHSSVDSRSLNSRRNSPSYVSSTDCLQPTNRLRPISVGDYPDDTFELQRNDHLRVFNPNTVSQKRRSSKCSDDSLDAVDDPFANSNPEKTLRNKFREKTITFFKTKNRSASSASELANEQKATRVLGLVFGCFVICWTPFFVQNFTLAFCGHHCLMPHWLTSMFLWLGYLSSTINPIIYTTFNKRFRQAFANILKCKCARGRVETHQKRLSRVSASSFHSTANHYRHGSVNSCHLTISPNGHVGSFHGKSPLNRTPPDLIASNALDTECLSVLPVTKQ